MKHLVVALLPTVMGPQSYIVKNFVGEHDQPNAVPDFSASKKNLEDWITLEEYLARSGFMASEQGLKTNGKPNPFPFTIDEFILSNCGALTALFYDEAGKFDRKLTWEFVRG